MSDKVLIESISSDFNVCRICGESGLVYQASNELFYCGICRDEHIKRGEMEIGEFTAAAHHKPIYTNRS